MEMGKQLTEEEMDPILAKLDEQAMLRGESLQFLLSLYTKGYDETTMNMVGYFKSLREKPNCFQALSDAAVVTTYFLRRE